jgi:hypothetical protein
VLGGSGGWCLRLRLSIGFDSAGVSVVEDNPPSFSVDAMAMTQLEHHLLLEQVRES